MLKMALEPPGATKLLVMASPYKPFGAQARIQDLFSSEPFVSFIRVRGPRRWCRHHKLSSLIQNNYNPAFQASYMISLRLRFLTAIKVFNRR